MPDTAIVALKPGSSSGRVVVIFSVEPIPPVGTSALPLLIHLNGRNALTGEVAESQKSD